MTEICQGCHRSAGWVSPARAAAKIRWPGHILCGRCASSLINLSAALSGPDEDTILVWLARRIKIVRGIDEKKRNETRRNKYKQDSEYRERQKLRWREWRGRNTEERKKYSRACWRAHYQPKTRVKPSEAELAERARVTAERNRAGSRKRRAEIMADPVRAETLREKQRKLSREYYNKHRLDPFWMEKQKEHRRRWLERQRLDPSYVDKRREYFRRYREKTWKNRPPRKPPSPSPQSKEDRAAYFHARWLSIKEDKDRLARVRAQHREWYSRRKAIDPMYRKRPTWSSPLL